METSALYSQAAVFSQQDDCGYFVLGLAHAAVQLFSSLDYPIDEPGEGSLEREPDNAQYLLLGLISFFGNYLGMLEKQQAGLAEGETGVHPADDTARPADFHGWLR
jgi:hypothetical protein